MTFPMVFFSHLRLSKCMSLGSFYVLICSILLTSCALDLPRDPNGSLERIRGNELRVGISREPVLAEVGDDGIPTGPLVDLAKSFAGSLDATISWTVAGEESLVNDLEEGRLDLAIGGLTQDTPWADKVGVTRGYSNIAESDGRQLVMLVPMGENALLSSLEAFLDQQVGS